jgi:NAD-dependent SIR2 family protein deacetylase
MTEERHPDSPSPLPSPLKRAGVAENLALVRERVATAKNIMVITGAGISAESGIPTFRDDRGLWKEFNPLDYATREAFRRDPVKVWKRQHGAGPAKPGP